MEIEVLDYRLYMAVHVDVCEYSEQIKTSFFYPCKNMLQDNDRGKILTVYKNEVWQYSKIWLKIKASNGNLCN